MKTTTTSGNHTEKEVKRTSVKRTGAAKDSSHGKSSITDKSTPKAKATVHHTTVKHPVKDKATTTGRTTTIHKEDTSTSTKTAAIQTPVRRKRIRKTSDSRSDIVLYEHTGTLLNGFIILVGLFLLAEGIWGMQSDVVFNVLTTNTTHAVIHIVLGIIAVIVGAKQNAYGFSVFLGLLLASVGVLRFIPQTADLVITYLNVNETVAALNIGIGLLALLLSFTDTKSYHTVSH